MYKSSVRYCLSLITFVALTGPARADAASYDGLIARLIRDGYDTAWVRGIYQDPRAEFLPAIAQINIKHVEDTAAHRTFLEEKNLSIARNYFARHRELLKRFESKTAVPAEIVVAILLIETKCGLDRDKAPVLNVLSTIAVCTDEKIVDQSYTVLKARYPDLTVGEVRRRAASRSRWAYRELQAFLDWLKRRPREDVYAHRGSWAGAIGLPQFMPSSLRAFGADGDGDGRIDLHEDADAIASVCHYLKRNGWKTGQSDRQRRRVIWRYNHSLLYVDTVLGVAERISK